jgi:hypothetical protein
MQQGNDFNELISLLRYVKEDMDSYHQRLDLMDAKLNRLEQLINRTIQVQQNLNNDLQRWNARVRP